jgi:hypothetical protein
LGSGLVTDRGRLRAADAHAEVLAAERSSLGGRLRSPRVPSLRRRARRGQPAIGQRPRQSGRVAAQPDLEGRWTEGRGRRREVLDPEWLTVSPARRRRSSGSACRRMRRGGSAPADAFLLGE